MWICCFFVWPQFCAWKHSGCFKQNKTNCWLVFCLYFSILSLFSHFDWSCCSWQNLFEWCCFILVPVWNNRSATECLVLIYLEPGFSLLLAALFLSVLHLWFFGLFDVLFLAAVFVSVRNFDICLLSDTIWLCCFSLGR